MQTPLDTRVYDYVAQHQTIDDQTPYANGEELIDAGKKLINLDELIYLVVSEMLQQAQVINQYDVSVVLWLLIYKDVINGHRFIYPLINKNEFTETGIGWHPEIMSKTSMKTYNTNHMFAEIAKLRPVSSVITNPEHISDPTWSEHYLKPAYQYYANVKHAQFKEIPDTDDKQLWVVYTTHIKDYAWLLQSWLQTNIPIAIGLIKQHPDVVKTTSIINEKANLNANGALRHFSAKSLHKITALNGHRKSVKKILQFLNM